MRKTYLPLWLAALLLCTAVPVQAQCWSCGFSAAGKSLADSLSDDYGNAAEMRRMREEQSRRNIEMQQQRMDMERRQREQAEDMRRMQQQQRDLADKMQADQRRADFEKLLKDNR
tara:strand:+ start:471 stop:815 length:345 start_codon:yes stop_codon:yes gene_type:complete